MQGPALVYLQVANAGTIRGGLGLDIGIYGVDDGDSRTLIATHAVEANVEPGATTDVIMLQVAAADLAGYVSLAVVVDDGAGTNECVEDNNEAVLALPEVCP